MSLILKQELANTIPTPPAGKGTLYLNDTGAMQVKQPDGNIASFPTVSAGSNTQVMFNDAGGIGQDANFTYTKTTDTLSVANLSVTGTLYAGDIAVSSIANGTSNVDIVGVSGNITVSVAGNANILTVTGTGAIVDGSFSADGVLVGATAMQTDFPNALAVISKGDTGQIHNENIGVVGEAVADSGNTSTWGIGVLGEAKANGATKATGVQGGGYVTNTSDTGAAVGVRGYSIQTHAGGYNIGVLGNAAGSGLGNYAFYVQAGNIASIENATSWDLVDNSSTALAFQSSGKANILGLDTTDGSEGVYTSGYLSVTGNAAVGGVKTDNYYYANGAPVDFQQAGGSNTQVQFNDQDGFGGSANFTFDKATNILSVNGNIQGANLATAGTLSVGGNANIGNIGTAGIVTAGGTITGGNLATAGTLSAGGNANVGNIGATAGVFTTVAGSLTTAAQPNVTSLGTLTGVSVSGNANIGNIGTGIITATGNIDGANLNTAGVASIGGTATAGNLATAGTLSAGGNANVGNLGTAGLITATGAIQTSSTLSAVGNANVGNLGTAVITATGNITGGNLVTGGALSVTGNANVGNIGADTAVLTTGNITTINSGLIQNGNSNITITANGNISVQAVGGSVELVVTSTGANVTGTFSASGNANVANLGVTGVYATTVSATGNANVGNLGTGGVITATSTITGGNLATAGTLSAGGNANVGNLGTDGLITVTGNVSAGNVVTGGVVTATGNVTGGNLTTAGVVTATGNVTGGNLTTAGVLSVSGTSQSTIAGNLTMSSKNIINLADPVNAQDAATKNYVDNSVQGLDAKASVALATATALPAYTYDNGSSGVGATLTGSSNGALSIDGNQVVIGQRVLVKNETSSNAPYNGIYVVTVAGTAGSAYVLTRSTDFDTAAEIVSAFVFVETGATNADTGWVCTNDSGATIGTTNITFTQFSGAGSYTAGTGLTLTGAVFSVNTSQTQVTAVGTLTTLSVSGNANVDNIGATNGVFTSVSGTLSTASQTNITSVGTLGSLSVSGNANIGNIGTAGLVTATGTITGGNLATGGTLSSTGNANVGNLGTAGLITATGAIQTSSTLSAVGNANVGNLGTGTAIITTGNITTINSGLMRNGTSNVTVASGGNVSIFVAGNATARAVFTSTGANVAGTLSVSGNANVGNLGATGVYATILSGTGNANVGNLGTTGVYATTLSGTGNANVGNLGTAGLITATGNINSTAFLNGANLSITGNANVGNIGATLHVGNLSGTGNSNVGNLGATGVYATILSGTGNANVGNLGTAGLITATGNITGGNLVTSGALSVSGNANVGNLGTGAVFADYLNSSGNASLGGWLFVTGTIDSTTDISAGGNLSASGKLSINGNANIGNMGTSGLITATGNIGGGNLNTGGILSVGGTAQSSIAGNLTMTSKNIINLADPVNAQDAATKNYVDTVVQGLHVHDSCYVATTGTLATATGGTVTYNNGSSGVGATLTTTGTYLLIDGANVQTVGTRIMVKNEANAAWNGIYTYTSTTVLTRATDFDTSAEAAGGDFFFITSGSTQADTGWVQTTDNPTIGTSNIVFTQFSGAGSYTAGTGLTLTGTTFSVNTSQTQVTAVGTLTTLSVSGNANIGNVGAALFVGNLSGTGNSNVGNLGATGVYATTLSGTGNANVGNLGVTGVFATTLSATGNANVGNIGATNIVGTLTTAAQTNITSVGTLTGLGVNGTVTAVDITANTGVFTGNANGLSSVQAANIVGTTLSSTVVSSSLTAVGTLASLSVSGNANIGNIGTAGLITATGNLTAGNVITAGIMSSTGNANVGNLGTAGLITATGNITTSAQLVSSVATGTAPLVVTSTTQVANLSVATAGSATTAGTVTTAAQPNITSVGTLTSLGVNGTITGVNITANTGVFTGNANGLSSVQAANIVGTTLSSTVVSSSLTAVGTLTTLSVSGNANVGNIGATNGVFTSVSGTLSTASQTNITSVGTLGSLSVSGNANIGNIGTAGLITATGNIGGGNLNTGGILSVGGTAQSSIAGNLTMTSKNIINLADPVNAQDAATKNYVDSVSQGLDTKASVRLATAGALAAYTYNNGTSGVGATITANAVGALSIDGTAVSANDRVLIKNETTTNAPYNGIYTVTNAGGAGAAFVLTRTTDMDTWSEVPGAYVFVEVGSTNADTGWVCTSDAGGTMGTTAISWTQFSGAGTYVAGTGLTLTGTTFSVNASQTQITAVGTLTTLSVSGNANVGNIGATNGVFTSISGNGSALTAINASNITSGTIDSARVPTLNQNTTGYAATVSGAAQANITSVGTLTSLSVSGNANVGNIGATNFVGSGASLTSLNGSNITSGTIDAARVATLNQNTTGYAATVSTNAQPNITSVGTLTSLSVSGNANVGNIGATNFVGSGASLTSINGSNVTGTVANATYATSAGSATTATSATSATTAGTVTTAAQPNITSVGTLTSVSVSGNANIGNIGTSGILTVTGNATVGNLIAGTGTGGNITGANLVSANYITGTLTTAAQPNITSLGTLSSGLTVGSNTALTVTNLTTGANTTAGYITGNWSLTTGSKLNATYADLAEKYVADANYQPGTVLVFGGEFEVTEANVFDSTRVAGVVSTDPAYVMNAGCEGENVVTLALTGRVPVKVLGPVFKGDLMVTANNGHAIANNDARAGTIIGKALENFSGTSGVIEVVVGRV